MSDPQNIKVEYGTVTDAIGTIRTATHEYENITSNGFTEELSNLETMNSDYLDKLYQVLVLLGDDVKTNISFEMNDLVDRSEVANTAFNYVDNGIADQISGEGREETEEP